MSNFVPKDNLFNNYSPEIIEKFMKVTREIVPDGGPLDDDWPNYTQQVAGELIGEFPEVFDPDMDIDDLVNELIALC